MELRTSKWRPVFTHTWQAAAIAALAGVVVWAASHATSYTDFNQWTYDFTVMHAGLSGPARDVVLVDFDEESFQRIGKYPVPRSTVAEVVARVGAQKPRVVGLDMFLSEVRSPEEDPAMQKALTDAGVVVLASQDSVGILPPVVPLAQFCQPEDARAASGFCKEGTPGALGYAFVNLPMDADGFVRQGLLFSSGKPVSPSFALTLAQQYTGDAIAPGDAANAVFLGHRVFYADRGLRTFLIGSWGKEPATTIPAWKLLAGQVAADAMADRLVLIGQSSDAARDRHFTPLFRQADADGVRLRMGGTQIQAAAVRSLVEGTVVRPATPLLEWVMVLASAWVASFLLLRLRTGWGVSWVVLLCCAACWVELLLYAKARFWLPFLPMQTGMAVTLPLTLGLQFVLERVVSGKERAQRTQMMKMFSSYVDPAVANTIWERRDEVQLGGEERTATVMFTDIRSFTAMSAGRPPAEVLHWLNRYMTAMDEVIREHGGFLNKFIGDGLMIIFGLPLSHGVEADAVRAVEAALAMVARVERLNEEAKDDTTLPQLRIGVGMHTGTLMAGSIGSAARQEYSVIGATVNLASRLESLNKTFQTEVLMSEATFELVGSRFRGLKALGPAMVAGLEEPVAVYAAGSETTETQP